MSDPIVNLIVNVSVVFLDGNVTYGQVEIQQLIKLIQTKTKWQDNDTQAIVKLQALFVQYSLPYKQLSNECGICYREKSSCIDLRMGYLFPCCHQICYDCLKQIQRNVCPFCRCQLYSFIQK